MSSHPLSRRSFIQMGAGLAASLAAAPLGALAALDTHHLSQSATEANSTLIGVMLPETRQLPDAAAHLLHGIQQALGTQHTLLTERSGITSDSVVLAAQYLLEAGSKLLIGLVSPTQTEALHPILHAHDAVLLALTPGETVVQRAHPRVFYASLGYWQSAYAAGQWAARQHGGRAMLLASFYESGFDTVYAFEQGVSAAGGQLIDRHITHVHPTADRLAAALSAVRANRPDVVYAAYQGAQAAAFLKAYRGAGLTAPLVAAPFMPDAQSHTVISAAHGQQPFMALGQTAGQWLSRALDAARGDILAVRHHLPAAAVAGHHFDASTHTLLANQLVVRHNGAQLAYLPTPAVTLSGAGQSGWTFGYLTV